jgi:hypothetical protein
MVFQQENNFNGSFPSGQIFNSCLSLVNVSLSYNEFTGPVLEEGATLPVNLTFLLMSYNNFSGSIPSAIGGTTKLQFLDLAFNNLSGNVPPEVLSKLTTAPSAQINLSFNKLNVSKQSTQPGFGLFTCSPQVYSSCHQAMVHQMVRIVNLSYVSKVSSTTFTKFSNRLTRLHIVC